MENQPSMGDLFLSKIVQLIEDNLDNENFSVEDLAQKAGLSRSMLHRKLIKLTGKSASDFIMEKRLLKAKELLENDVATASEIAYKVGFKSPSYFNKVFHKYFNISPGSVRKNAGVNSGQQIIVADEQARNTQHTRKQVLVRNTLMILAALVITSAGLYFILSLHQSGERSIAVLPLHNLTGGTENDYFVDGMHDALIGELGSIRSLRVISRTSTLRYHDTNKLLKDIARELGVNTIVEGSVVGAGDSLRILIQLIDVYPKERHLLANEYHDGMQNVLTVQSSAVKDIAQKIRIKLSKKEEQRLEKPRKVDPETYKDYLRGMYYLNQGTDESFGKGIGYLQHAIDRDPGDPFAYGALALGYTIMGHGQLNSEEAFLVAMNSANKALKLDPANDEAHTALSILYLYNIWDWSLAKESFEKALAGNPNNEVAHAHFAWYHILFNDKEKTLYHAKQAVMLEPFSASYCSWLAILSCYYRDYENAEYWGKKALSLEETIPYGYFALSWASLSKKMYRQAVEFIDHLPDDDAYWKTLRGYVYTQAGQRERAVIYWNEMVEEAKMQSVNTCYMGMMAAYLGFTGKAFELLNDAVEKKIYPITYINFYPCTEDIRQDPRYDQLLRKMNLPTGRMLITSNE